MSETVHFQKIDPNLASGEVAKILEYVRRVGKVIPEAGEAGATVFESIVNIGGKNVVVRTVESASKVIKSGYPFIRY